MSRKNYLFSTISQIAPTYANTTHTHAFITYASCTMFITYIGVLYISCMYVDLS